MTSPIDVGSDKRRPLSEPESSVKRVGSATYHQITDPDMRLLAEMADENAQAIVSILRRLPSDEDLAYIRNKREAEEWWGTLGKWVRGPGAWYAGILGAISTAIYHLAKWAIDNIQIVKGH